VQVKRLAQVRYLEYEFSLFGEGFKGYKLIQRKNSLILGH